jgi:uncharacterized protein
MAQIRVTSLSIARRTHMAQDQERTSQRGGTKETNPGNFANDRERASRAGHKGGQASGGNFANDRQRASEAGRKGGQNSHGGGRNP